MSGEVICRYFLRGLCRFGENCRYSHTNTNIINNIYVSDDNDNLNSDPNSNDDDNSIDSINDTDLFTVNDSNTEGLINEATTTLRSRLINIEDPNSWVMAPEFVPRTRLQHRRRKKKQAKAAAAAKAAKAKASSAAKKVESSIEIAGPSSSSVKEAGSSLSSLNKGPSSSSIKCAGPSSTSVKGAGPSSSSVKNAKPSSSSIKCAGPSSASVKGAGPSSSSVKNAEPSTSSAKNTEPSLSSANDVTNMRPTVSSSEATNMPAAETALSGENQANRMPTLRERQRAIFDLLTGAAGSSNFIVPTNGIIDLTRHEGASSTAAISDPSTNSSSTDPLASSSRSYAEVVAGPSGSNNDDMNQWIGTFGNVFENDNDDDDDDDDGGCIKPFIVLKDKLPELCPFESLCPYGKYCVYTHGELCDLCGQFALHPTDEEQRKKHIAECVEEHEITMEFSFAIARSKDKTCGICFDIIMEKGGYKQRFGILPNCNHVFCLGCIRKWRQAKQFENKITRACPECRVPSDYVCPSPYWVDTKEDKEKLLTAYKDALGKKDCKYFQKGEGKCPFGNKCFYKHALPNGKLVDVGLPVKSERRRRGGDDAFLELFDRVFPQIHLWDFLDARNMQSRSESNESSEWSDEETNLN